MNKNTQPNWISTGSIILALFIRCLQKIHVTILYYVIRIQCRHNIGGVAVVLFLRKCRASKYNALHTCFIGQKSRIIVEEAENEKSKHLGFHVTNQKSKI